MRAVLTFAALLLSWQAFAAECVTVKYRDTTVWLGRGKGLPDGERRRTSFVCK